MVTAFVGVSVTGLDWGVAVAVTAYWVVAASVTVCWLIIQRRHINANAPLFVTAPLLFSALSYLVILGGFFFYIVDFGGWFEGTWFDSTYEPFQDPQIGNFGAILISMVLPIILGGIVFPIVHDIVFSSRDRRLKRQGQFTEGKVINIETKAAVYIHPASDEITYEFIDEQGVRHTNKARGKVGSLSPGVGVNVYYWPHHPIESTIGE